METIIAAAISGILSAGAAIIVSVITQRSQSEKAQAKLEAQLDKGMALIDERLRTLSDRVDKHNNVIERTYKLEERTEIQEEKIKVANHRIEDLERKQQG